MDNKFLINKAKRLRGDIDIPGDKSISHRGLMLGAIAKGDTRITGFLDSADCKSSASVLRNLGIDIMQSGTEVCVHGKGMHGLKEPKDSLYVGNSGTTMRLMSGILAGSGIASVLDGDKSIRKRPMKRIMEPLSKMGADFTCLEEDGKAPYKISGGHLKGIEYNMPVASAQVKSAVLLAGLYSDSETSVIEPNISRDHTERMLKAYGANIKIGEKITVYPASELFAVDIKVPADISSAAFFIAAGLIHSDAKLYLKGINVNPTRAGIIEVVKKMGGKISIENHRLESNEEVCDIYVESSELSGTKIDGAIIPTLIDELPVIAVMAAFANGDTIIKDAKELRVKESDRIEMIYKNLSKMGASVETLEDGLVIHGGRPLNGTRIETADDHRIAMAFAIAGLVTGDMSFDNPSCVNISYENFYNTLFSIIEV